MNTVTTHTLVVDSNLARDVFVKVGVCYLCVVIACYVSEALALRKEHCLVKINSDLNKETENVADTENGRTK